MFCFILLYDFITCDLNRHQSFSFHWNLGISACMYLSKLDGWVIALDLLIRSQITTLENTISYKNLKKTFRILVQLFHIRKFVSVMFSSSSLIEYLNESVQSFCLTNQKIE